MRRIGFLATLVCLCVGASAPAQILVSDFLGNLTSYDPSSNTYTTHNAGFAQPGNMTMGPDGYLYVANMATGTVDKYNAYTGAFSANIANPTTLGPNFQPAGIKFVPGSPNEMYISNQVSFPFAPSGPPGPMGHVVRYNISTQTPTTILSNMVQPNSMLAHNGNLDISELRNYFGHVVKYDFVNPASEFISNVADPGNPGTISASTGMAIGPDGMLYVCDVLDSVIRRYDLNNPAINSVFIAAGPGLFAPSDLVFDDGHLYVSNVGSGTGPDGFLSRFNWTTGAFEGIVVPNLLYGSSVVAVPEPTSLALVGIGAFGWLWKRRRIA
jgi:hypothetical protein